MALPRLQNALGKRLTYLRNREGLAAAVLALLIPFDWIGRGGEIAWALRAPALALFIYVLVQGTLYWHYKLRSLDERTPMPSNFYSLFTAFKWSNMAGIGAMLVVLLGASRNGAPSADIGWTSILLAGAILEQINYYHYQLMYDTGAAFDFLRRNKRLRKAALGLDIARAKPAA